MWDWGVPCRTSLSVASAGFSSAATCVILCRSASSLLVSSSPARKTAPVDDWRARDRSRPRSRSGKGKRRCRGRSAREAGARVRVPPAPPRLPRVVGLPWSGVGRFRSPRGGPAGVRLPAFHPVAVVLAGTFARDAMAPLAHLRRRRRRADELAQAQHLQDAHAGVRPPPRARRFVLLVPQKKKQRWSLLIRPACSALPNPLPNSGIDFLDSTKTKFHEIMATTRVVFRRWRTHPCSRCPRPAAVLPSDACALAERAAAATPTATSCPRSASACSLARPTRAQPPSLSRPDLSSAPDDPGYHGILQPIFAPR